MQLAETSCVKEGLRPIDVRHEQARCLMAQAYSRLRRPRRSAWRERSRRDQSGPRGVANALIDCARSSPSAAPADQPVRPPDLPGDRSARDHEGLHQVADRVVNLALSPRW